MAINLNELLKNMMKNTKYPNPECKSTADIRPMNLNPNMLLVKCEKCGTMGPVQSFKVHLK